MHFNVPMEFPSLLCLIFLKTINKTTQLSNKATLKITAPTIMYICVCPEEVDDVVLELDDNTVDVSFACNFLLLTEIIPYIGYRYIKL